MTNSDQHDNREQSASAERPQGDQGRQSGADAPPTDELARLQQELAACREESAGHRDQFIRAQAELDNYRKRTNKEVEQMLRYQALPLARDLLPGLDNLERTLKAAQVAPNVDDLVQGVELIQKQFLDVLARHSIEPVSAVGETFDPNRHEAILQIPSADHPPMTIIEEAERGYVLHDRVVRPSKVVVAQSPAAAGKNSDSEEAQDAQ